MFFEAPIVHKRSQFCQSSKFRIVPRSNYDLCDLFMNDTNYLDLIVTFMTFLSMILSRPNCGLFMNDSI